MESSLRRRNGRTASAISVGSASQQPAAVGLDVELGLPFSLDGPADASLASWSRPGSSPAATLATSQTSTATSTSASRSYRLPRIEAQVAPARVTVGSRNAFASSHASSSTSAAASTSSIPRPLASMPIPRRRIQTTPSSSLSAASTSTPSRERTASGPVIGHSVPRLELSPHSLSSFKRSFRETGELAFDTSAPIASGSTQSPSSADSTRSSGSTLDFAFLDASALSDMSASSSATSPEVDEAGSGTSSSQSLPTFTLQPNDSPPGSPLYGSSSSIPQHSPPTPSAHSRVKRRRSGSRNSGRTSASSLPRLIGRSRRNNVTSAPEILERNAQADLSQRSGEDARFLDTPAPEAPSFSASSTRSSATHPSTLATFELPYIQPALLTEVGPGSSSASAGDLSTTGSSSLTGDAAASSTDASSVPRTGLIHRRSRRFAHNFTFDPLPPLSSLPPLPPRTREAPRASASSALPPLPASLRTPVISNPSIAPSSPISVRRRGNAPPFELGELPSFDIDWDQIRFGEGARYASQITAQRRSSQPQRPNLHRNATAVTPPEESPLTTPDGDIAAVRPAETYRTFFHSGRDGDTIMEDADDEEYGTTADVRSETSHATNAASIDEDEILGDYDYNELSDVESVASSSSWLRTIVGEGEVASNNDEFADPSSTYTDQHRPRTPTLNVALPSSNALDSTADVTPPLETGISSDEETAPWNLASEFQRAERLSQLIERRRSIATEVESYQTTRHDTPSQAATGRFARHSEDARTRLRALRAQINRDRDAFLEPFEWQLTSDDEEVASATSIQANVSSGRHTRPETHSRARLWGEIQNEQPLSRNLLTSPVGLPRPSLSVSTATTSGVRSSGTPTLRRRPGSLGSGSMRGPTRSSNEAWLRNQGIDLHESLSLPSLQPGSSSHRVNGEEQDDDATSLDSLASRERASSNWSRGSSSAARALRRIAARLPVDNSTASEPRYGDISTAAELLRRYGGRTGEESLSSLPILRYPRAVAPHRSYVSDSSPPDEVRPQLDINLPSLSPLSNLLPLPPIDAASPVSANGALLVDDPLNGSAGPSHNVMGPRTEAPGVPGRFRWRGPANLASAQSMPRPPSPPSYHTPVSPDARSRLLDRLRDQSSRASMALGDIDIARITSRGPDIIERHSEVHGSLQSSEAASQTHSSAASFDDTQPQGSLGQVRQSLDTIRRILDDLETGTPRSSRNGSSDPSSSNTSTLLSPSERIATSESVPPLPNVPEARPSRISAPSHAERGWQPGHRNQLIPPLPELPSFNNMASNTAGRPQRPRRPMLQPFDEIYAEVEAEFAGRDRVRERLPRRRSAFMQDILAELEQRRSAPSTQATRTESRDLNDLELPGFLSTAQPRGQTPTSEDHLQSQRTSRDRLLERLSSFSRNQPPVPPLPSGAGSGSGWIERSTNSSFARRWGSLLSEDEEERVPLPPFMWRSLRTSTTLGGIASESANYVSDSELDTSYEGLLALSDRIGSVRPRGATEQALRAGLERSTFKIDVASATSSDALPVAVVDREVRCGICLEDYGEGDVLAKSKKCGHALHAICFETWLKRVDTCPICRQSAV